MTREQNIFETNNYNGGFLVDRETNLPVGFTSRGVDQNFVTASTDPVTGSVVKNISVLTQAQYDALSAPDAATLYVIVD